MLQNNAGNGAAEAILEIMKWLIGAIQQELTFEAELSAITLTRSKYW